MEDQHKDEDEVEVVEDDPENLLDDDDSLDHLDIADRHQENQDTAWESQCRAELATLEHLSKQIQKDDEEYPVLAWWRTGGNTDIRCQCSRSLLVLSIVCLPRKLNVRESSRRPV